MLDILLGQTAALATVVTAVVAYFLYRKSKNDELETAIRIIILEIKESERVIKHLDEIKNSGNPYPNDLMRVTPQKGWVRYSHLFISKLTNDEYDQLNEYFKKCDLLEKYIEKNHNFFWITTEERAKLNESTATRYAFKHPDIQQEEFIAKVSAILKMSCQISSYTPSGIKTQIDRILNSTTLITLTPVWNKLKKIAKYNDLLG